MMEADCCVSENWFFITQQAGEVVATEPQKLNLTYMIGGTSRAGLSVPRHCSALDKALLAHGAASLSPGWLERRADKTITIRAVLEADLADALSRGHAVTDQELKPGLIAIAATGARGCRP